MAGVLDKERHFLRADGIRDLLNGNGARTAAIYLLNAGDEAYEASSGARARRTASAGKVGQFADKASRYDGLADAWKDTNPQGSAYYKTAADMARRKATEVLGRMADQQHAASEELLREAGELLERREAVGALVGGFGAQVRRYIGAA